MCDPCDPPAPARTAQVTGLAELWNCELKRSDVLVFASTLHVGNTVCLVVHGVPHTIKLELGGPTTDAELEELRQLLDADVREWLERRAYSDIPKFLECGRTNCAACGNNAWRVSDDGVRVARERFVFSTEPCSRTLADAHASRENSCVVAVKRVRGAPMSGFVVADLEFAEFELAGAYYAPRVFWRLKKWISEERGWLSTDQVRGCGVEVYDVRVDTVLSFLAATHALYEQEGTPTEGCNGLGGFKHVIVPAAQKQRERRATWAQEEYDVEFAELKWTETEVRPAPLRVLGYDIEASGLDPKRDHAIMVSVAADVVHLSEDATELRGTPRTAAHCIVTPGKLESAVDMPAEAAHVHLHLVSGEADMLREFTSLVHKYDADVLTGYNINGYDFPFLAERAETLGRAAEFAQLSRVRKLRSTHQRIARQSRQSGTRFLTFYNLPGRLVIDMQEEVRARRQLSVYTLKEVSFTLFVDDKFGVDVGAKAKAGRFAEFEAAVRAALLVKGLTEEAASRKAATLLNDVTKRDLPWQQIMPHHDGSAQQRGHVVDYCVQDAVLAVDMFKDQNVATSLAAKASICGVAPHHVPVMMQQALLSCAFQRFCHHHRIFKAKHRQMLRAEFPPGYFGVHETGRPPNAAPAAAPAAPEDEEDSDSEEDEDEDEAPLTAELLEPDEEEEPVPKPLTATQLKRQREIEAMRIAYVPAYFGQKPPRLTKWIHGVGYHDPNDVRTTTTKAYAGGFVRVPEPGLFEQTIATLDFNSMYPNIMRGYNISCNTSLPPDWQSNPYYSKTLDAERDVRLGLMGTHWVKEHVRIGIFSYILKYFLDARQKYKALVKTTKDPVLRAVYSALEGQCKVLANSLYGAMGAPSSDFANLAAAAETTGIGASLIQQVAKRIETHKAYAQRFDSVRPRLVGGDTDSVFVLLESKRHYDWDPVTKKRVGRPKMDLVFEDVRWMANDINKCGIYEPPSKIDIDKVAERSLIQRKKKRYVIVSRASPDEPPKISSRGMETVRRDTLPATRGLLQRLNKMIMDVTRPVDTLEVFREVKRSVQAVLSNKLPTREFIKTAGVTKPLAQYPDHIAHIELLRRLERENPSAPRAQVGDRVEFVYADVPGATKAWERARTPEELERLGLCVDLVFNYLRQVKPAVQRYLDPFCSREDIDDALDLRRYAFQGVARTANTGASVRGKRHLAQSGIRDFFEDLKRTRGNGD